MTEPAIKICDLGKMYKLYQHPADKVLDAFGVSRWLFWRKAQHQEFWAIRSLNLEVKKGERLGIIGRNGAGKSTLLKIITGNVTPTEGTVEVQGKVQALMELGTGFHPEFTGRQNIRASLAYQGLSLPEIREKEDEIIDFSELEDFIDQPIKTYSAGMYARLGFSTATSVKPEILIIDEVLGAGDAYFAGKCVERMKKLTEQSGATVLFVSHDLGSVQALCDRIIWIQKGVIAGDGKPLNIIKQYSRTVRRDEEIRLRARDLKISKKQATMLDKQTNIYEKLLFRLISQGSKHPIRKHKIYSITLKDSQEIIGEIDIGSPMDNHPDQDHYLMTSAGFMDWGEAIKQKDKLRCYRFYGDFQGKYAHAPFQFSVPKSYLHNSNNFTLEIRADCQEEEITVQLFLPDQDTYHDLGFLQVNSAYSNLPIPTELLSLHNELDFLKESITKQKEDKSPSPLEQTIDEYGSKKEAEIIHVSLFDNSEKETKILYSLEPFQITVEYRTNIPIVNPTFVFCIYLASGLTASQWAISSKELGKEVIEGHGKILFWNSSLLLGAGSYVASVAMFKSTPRKGVEPEPYHVLDRCIHFQVVNRDYLETIDHGICRQPIHSKLEESIEVPS
ncbi:ABC transporter ATP-binding protein [[Limnothrix rosea] IAM M-220]|nr:ABC transporter ATP-binding protein [[Limnothrix rosea] IAM M-220]